MKYKFEGRKRYKTSNHASADRYMLKKLLQVFAVVAVIIGFIVFITVFMTHQKDNDNYISRALASRMLVLLDMDMPSVKSTAFGEKHAGYDADNPLLWYVKYMYELDNDGYIKWSDDEYCGQEFAYSAFTYGELREYLVNKDWNVSDMVEDTGVDIKRGKASKKIKKTEFDKI